MSRRRATTVLEYLLAAVLVTLLGLQNSPGPRGFVEAPPEPEHAGPSVASVPSPVPESVAPVASPSPRPPAGPGLSTRASVTVGTGTAGHLPLDLPASPLASPASAPLSPFALVPIPAPIASLAPPHPASAEPDTGWAVPSPPESAAPLTAPPAPEVPSVSPSPSPSPSSTPASSTTTKTSPPPSGPDALDPALIGTWESRFSTEQGSLVWTWTIAADGSYRWSTSGPIPLPEETGRLYASEGRFTRSSADGRTDIGTYEIKGQALTLRTPAFEQHWTKK